MAKAQPGDSPSRVRTAAVLSWIAIAAAGCTPLGYSFNGSGGNALLGALIVGTLVAHAAIAAFWTAFGVGDLGGRFARGVGWLLYLSTAVGIGIPDPEYPTGVFAFVLLGLIWLGVQLPLHVVAYFAKRRLAEPADGNSAAHLRFSLQTFLLAAPILGILLVILTLSENTPAPFFTLLVSACAMLPLLAAAGVQRGFYWAVATALVFATGLVLVEYQLQGAYIPQMVLRSAPTHGVQLVWAALFGGIWRWAGYRWTEIPAADLLARSLIVQARNS